MDASDVIGDHPPSSSFFGRHLDVSDQHSTHGVPHRALRPNLIEESAFVAGMQRFLIDHHASEDQLRRERKKQEALARLGAKAFNGRFPRNTDTRKGNWAEIFLAEYIATVSKTDIPIYRLRYNSNVDQSMKGDDVLAFDLDSNPIKVMVGEAKFRSTPSKTAVLEIIEGLSRSQRLGVPMSLQYVADRLYEEGRNEIAEKVENCSILFAEGNLQMEHVGLLVSNNNVLGHVQRNAQTAARRLIMLSLSLANPDDMIQACYENIEDLS